jgi:predicted amidohydrolase YtcJ
MNGFAALDGRLFPTDLIKGRTGLQREAFIGSEGENAKGMAYIEKDVLDGAVERRLREGWAVCVHANGDAAIDRALDAFAKAKAKGLDPAAKRCRIEHCSILHDEQIEKMAELGLVAQFSNRPRALLGQGICRGHFWVGKSVEIRPYRCL